MNTGQDEEPLPSRNHFLPGDGTPPTAKTNHGRTNLHKGSNRRAKTDIVSRRQRPAKSAL
ncbi:BnaC09g13400D [Brassica napus]|uniref:BnaC09g13400D protein n=1 Tax=Brassica napus TaxID=3708 RepID=A0A078G4G8_BRANA|nr:BnaC09g13400D [Brassica napus]